MSLCLVTTLNVQVTTNFTPPFLPTLTALYASSFYSGVSQTIKPRNIKSVNQTKADLHGLDVYNCFLKFTSHCCTSVICDRNHHRHYSLQRSLVSGYCSSSTQLLLNWNVPNSISLLQHCRLLNKFES